MSRAGRTVRELVVWHRRVKRRRSHHAVRLAKGAVCLEAPSVSPPCLAACRTRRSKSSGSRPWLSESLVARRVADGACSPPHVSVLAVEQCHGAGAGPADAKRVGVDPRALGSLRDGPSLGGRPPRRPGSEPRGRRIFSRAEPWKADAVRPPHMDPPPLRGVPAHVSQVGRSRGLVCGRGLVLRALLAALPSPPHVRPLQALGDHGEQRRHVRERLDLHALRAQAERAAGRPQYAEDIWGHICSVDRRLDTLASGAWDFVSPRPAFRAGPCVRCGFGRDSGLLRQAASCPPTAGGAETTRRILRGNPVSQRCPS